MNKEAIRMITTVDFQSFASFFISSFFFFFQIYSSDVSKYSEKKMRECETHVQFKSVLALFSNGNARVLYYYTFVQKRLFYLIKFENF